MMARAIARQVLAVAGLVFAVGAAAGPRMTATSFMQHMNNGEMLAQLDQVKEMVGKTTDILGNVTNKLLPAECAAGLRLADAGTRFEELGLPSTCRVVMGLMQGNIREATLGELAKLTPAEVTNLAKALQATTRLYQSVGGLQKDLESRMNEAADSRLTWAAYLQREGQRIEQGNKRAIERVQHEQRLIAAVESDYKFSRQFVDQIPKSVGVHQQMSMVNVQMNRVLQQGARINQLLAEAQGQDKAIEDSDKANRRLMALRHGAQLDQRDQARDRTVYQSIYSIDGNNNKNWNNLSGYKR